MYEGGVVDPNIEGLTIDVEKITGTHKIPVQHSQTVDGLTLL